MMKKYHKKRFLSREKSEKMHYIVFGILITLSFTHWAAIIPSHLFWAILTTIGSVFVGWRIAKI